MVKQTKPIKSISLKPSQPKSTNHRKRRLKLRRNHQFHRGSEIEKRAPGMEQYLHSKRNGKWVRDREKSVDQLVIVLNRMEKRKIQNQTVMIVGTTAELGRLIERVYADLEPTPRVRVSRTWVSGILTNFRHFQNDVNREGGGGSERRKRRRKGMETWLYSGVSGAKGKPVKHTEHLGLPGLILFRHPKDHVVGRKEARRCGIPTAGIVDSDCENADRMTYPIPGNDDSRSSQRRRMRRVKTVFESGKEPTLVPSVPSGSSVTSITSE